MQMSRVGTRGQRSGVNVVPRESLWSRLPVSGAGGPFRNSKRGTSFCAYRRITSKDVGRGCDTVPRDWMVRHLIEPNGRSTRPRIQSGQRCGATRPVKRPHLPRSGMRNGAFGRGGTVLDLHLLSFPALDLQPLNAYPPSIDGVTPGLPRRQ